MQKVIIGGSALVLVAGGVLAIVTGAVVYHRKSERHQFDRRGSARQNTDLAKLADLPSSESTRGKWMTEYTLIDRSGRAVHSKDLLGKLYVVNFFFASCPHNCRLLNTQMEKLHKEFARKGVKFVSITCDPKNDTPEVLRRYAATFQASDHWMFLTGKNSDDGSLYISRIGHEVYKERVAERTHTEHLILVDRQGKVVELYDWDSPQEIAELKKEIGKRLKD